MSYPWRRVASIAFVVLVMAVVSACSLELDNSSADENGDNADTPTEENETSESDAGETPETGDDDATGDAAAVVHNRGEDDRDYDEEPAVELIESDIDVEVTSDGYAPESDVLIALHGEMDPTLYLISPEGDVREAWRITNRSEAHLLDRRVLENGNIMFVIQGDGAYEMTREGEIVWAYEHGGLSHHGEILPNGNVLVAGSVCDCIQEIDYDSQEPVFYWDAHQAFPDYSEGGEAFHDGDEWGMQNVFRTHYDPDLEYPNTWGHANSTQKLESGNYIVSLRNLDTVLEINPEGETVWSFGPGIIKHQHTPRDLGDGTMLIFDNGNHRAFRFDRATGEVLWSYDELDSAIMGDTNLLEDGNYKVVDSLQFRVDIVSPEEERIWSMEVDPVEGANGIYRAHFPDLED